MGVAFSERALQLGIALSGSGLQWKWMTFSEDGFLMEWPSEGLAFSESGHCGLQWESMEVVFRGNGLQRKWPSVGINGSGL